MVAALALRAEGIARRVGILDADMHRGDGTEDIIDTLRLRDWVEHVSVGASPRSADSFIRELPAIVDGFSACDVLLYQAGADPHVDDPLGGWLTTEQRWGRCWRFMGIRWGSALASRNDISLHVPGAHRTAPGRRCRRGGRSSMSARPPRCEWAAALVSSSGVVRALGELPEAWV